MRTNSIKFIQDTDKTLQVMHNVAKWLQTKGKVHSKWWKPTNMNRGFMLKHAEPDEFYVALVNGKPTASVILQENERNQSWKFVDKDKPKRALYVHWLCVHRDFAGTGFPKIMIDFASEQAKNRGFKLLRLDTEAHERKLRKIYDDLNFYLVGIDESSGTAFYQKTIDSNARSTWMKDLYDMFAPVRKEISKRKYRDREIDTSIDEAVEAVRKKHGE